MKPIRHLLVAVDFDEISEHALDYALDMAAHMGARVTALHVYTVPVLNALAVDAEYIPTADEAVRLANESQRRLAAMLEPRQARGVPLEGLVHTGDVAAEVVRLARERDADMIVVGTHRRGIIERALLGSVAQAIIRHAPVPVLTVREGREARAA